jgi:hypothetical protein
MERVGKVIKWCNRSLINGPYFALCTSEKDFYKTMKKLYIKATDWPRHWISEGANATTHYLTNNKEPCFVVCIQENPEGVEATQIVALLVHEAVHIKQRFMEFIGEDKPSDEFEAYMVQTIAQQLMLAYPYKEEK